MDLWEHLLSSNEKFRIWKKENREISLFRSASGAPVGQVGEANRKDVRNAVEAAKKAQVAQQRQQNNIAGTWEYIGLAAEY